MVSSRLFCIKAFDAQSGMWFRSQNYIVKHYKHGSVPAAVLTNAKLKVRWNTSVKFWVRYGFEGTNIKVGVLLEVFGVFDFF